MTPNSSHSPTTRFLRPTLIALSGVCATLLTACRSAPTPVAYAREYPDGIARVNQTLDIQVIRDVRRIELTNTTARHFGKSTLWLNRRFSFPIDKLAIGERIVLHLSDFKDEFSDEFRGGGFFASEAPDVLVLAEIETIGDDTQPAHAVMLGMVVVKGTAD